MDVDPEVVPQREVKVFRTCELTTPIITNNSSRNRGLLTQYRKKLMAKLLKQKSTITKMLRYKGLFGYKVDETKRFGDIVAETEEHGDSC